jgi:hypothetical protein
MPESVIVTGDSFFWNHAGVEFAWSGWTPAEQLSWYRLRSEAAGSGDLGWCIGHGTCTFNAASSYSAGALNQFMPQAPLALVQVLRRCSMSVRIDSRIRISSRSSASFRQSSFGKREPSTTSFAHQTCSPLMRFGR